MRTILLHLIALTCCSVIWATDVVDDAVKNDPKLENEIRTIEQDATELDERFERARELYEAERQELKERSIAAYEKAMVRYTKKGDIQRATALMDKVDQMKAPKKKNKKKLAKRVVNPRGRYKRLPRGAPADFKIDRFFHRGRTNTGHIPQSVIQCGAFWDKTRNTRKLDGYQVYCWEVKGPSAGWYKVCDYHTAPGAKGSFYLAAWTDDGTGKPTRLVGKSKLFTAKRPGMASIWMVKLPKKGRIYVGQIYPDPQARMFYTTERPWDMLDFGSVWRGKGPADVPSEQIPTCYSNINFSPLRTPDAYEEYLCRKLVKEALK